MRLSRIYCILSHPRSPYLGPVCGACQAPFYLRGNPYHDAVTLSPQGSIRLRFSSPHMIGLHLVERGHIQLLKSAGQAQVAILPAILSAVSSGLPLPWHLPLTPSSTNFRHVVRTRLRLTRLYRSGASARFPSGEPVPLPVPVDPASRFDEFRKHRIEPEVNLPKSIGQTEIRRG